jgi:hypothetical protein
MEISDRDPHPITVPQSVALVHGIDLQYYGVMEFSKRPRAGIDDWLVSWSALSSVQQRAAINLATILYAVQPYGHGCSQPPS